MLLELFEIANTANSTASLMAVDGRPLCFVVEDGPREKKVKHETRIPAGVFKILPRKEGSFFTQYSKNFGHKFVLHLQDVPGFEFILIHIGNTIKDTSGCLLVNRFVGLGIDGNFSGTDSTSVYKLLYSLAAAALERGEKIYIKINRN
jgi:hypothetical protein